MRWSSGGAGEEAPLRAARGGGAMRGAAERMVEGRLLPVRGGREGEEGLLRVVPGRGRRLSGGVILYVA